MNGAQTGNSFGWSDPALLQLLPDEASRSGIEVAPWTQPYFQLVGLERNCAHRAIQHLCYLVRGIVLGEALQIIDVFVGPSLAHCRSITKPPRRRPGERMVPIHYPGWNSAAAERAGE